jgi:multimeric flavodoxin WrbA
MYVIAINGSSRKEWNTATMLKKALEGASSRETKTELVHLYDLNYTGCKSCFACKTRGGTSYGRCAVKDDLSPVLKKVEEADALILGSPIYFGTVSGQMKSFMERLLFAFLTYTNPPASLFPKKIQTGLIYTMNITEEQVNAFGLAPHFKNNERVMKLIFGSAESLYSYDTYQFDDYAKVVADRFDPEKKLQRHKEVFPKDCEKAFQMGVRFVDAAGS